MTISCPWGPRTIEADISSSHRAKGFETYLLRPGKTSDAIEVAQRENAVIDFEENKNKNYISEENLINKLYPEHMNFKTCHMAYRDGIGWCFSSELGLDIQKQWIKFHRRNAEYETLDPKTQKEYLDIQISV